MTGVVIIGAGHAGSQLAVSLRGEGYAGNVTLIDAEAALPYHKPPLSKTFLKDPQAQPQPLRAAQTYEGMRRVTGRVTSIDPDHRRITMASGDQLAYDDLVLATGARNRVLAGLEDATNVFSIRTLADAEALRAALPGAQDIVVIGGGFIGLECAAALAGIGKTVTVLEAAPRVLARVAAPETSATVQAALADLGVTVRTGWQGSGFARIGASIAAMQGRGESIKGDLVLTGIGAVAAIELAQAAGIACAGGILTDASLATSVPRIWAIGDAAETPHWQAGTPLRLESVQNATDQARHLARTLAHGAQEPFRTVPWFWSDIGPLKLQIAGLSLGVDATVVRSGAGKLAVFHLRQGHLVAVETLNSPADHMIARQLIAAGITPTADEMLAGPQALKALLAA
jgi:3-phenylpropionate/trans-cinnamate dioxygenase ferredoxin reductase component